MSKLALHIITCDNCGDKKELTSMHYYSEDFVLVNVNNLNRDICKKCARQMKFIPREVI